MKLRILQLTTCLEPGGAEQMILALAGDLAPRCDLTVAFLKGPGTLAPAFAALGARVLPLRLDHGRAFKGARRIRKLLAEGRFDLVHTHLFHAGLLGRALARLTGVRAVVHTQHNTLTWETQSRTMALANRVSLRLAHRVIAVGETVARMLRLHGGVPESRIALVYNGVDCNRFRPDKDRAYAESTFALPPRGPVIGVIAGLRPEKGHAVLLEAMPLVLRAVGDARLLVVGNGPLRESITKKIARGGLSDCVTLTGSRNDVDRIIPACDVVVLPGWQEGVPVSALEAMACAVPVVATDVGGTTEVVEHGQTGLVVPPGNPRAMAAAIIELLRKPAYAHALGKQGRERITEHFDLATMIEKTRCIYRELLDRNGGASLVWD